MKLRIHHEGRPIPYKRPSFRSKHNPKGAGTPKSKKQLADLTMLVKKALREAETGAEIGWDNTLPVKIRVEFGFAPPKDEGGAGKLFGYTDIVVEPLREPGYYSKEPDADNLVKMVCEALQHGGAVANDSQVVVLEITKEEDWRRWDSEES